MQEAIRKSAKAVAPSVGEVITTPVVSSTLSMMATSLLFSLSSPASIGIGLIVLGLSLASEYIGLKSKESDNKIREKTEEGKRLLAEAELEQVRLARELVQFSGKVLDFLESAYKIAYQAGKISCCERAFYLVSGFVCLGFTLAFFESAKKDNVTLPFFIAEYVGGCVMGFLGSKSIYKTLVSKSTDEVVNTVYKTIVPIPPKDLPRLIQAATDVSTDGLQPGRKRLTN